MKIPNGGPGEIPPVPERTVSDKFENAIRAVGAGYACEWFGHSYDSEFTEDTIRVLMERSAEDNK